MSNINIKPVTPAGQLTVGTVANKKQMLNATFAEKFEMVKSKEVKEHFQKKYDEIAEKAAQLGDKLYLKDLVEYKNLVKEFMDMAVKNSYAFSRDSFLDKRGRHRVLTQVKQVDRELAALTGEFLKDEVDRIKVLKKLDDIRGMLMDMFM
ncbi:MAG: YaaR family protein [Bacillota bacterium]